MFKKTNSKFWLVALAAAMVAGLTAPTVQAASPRLVVNLSEAFEVNGDVFEAGRLSVRTVRDFNPVTTLNEVRVDGRSLGVVLAQEQADAALATRNELIFERGPDGRLVLASIALKGEPVRKVQQSESQESPVLLATRTEPTRIASAK